MALNDVWVVDTAGLNQVPTKEFKVQDYTSSSSTQILGGEPCKISGAEGGNYALKLATGDPEIGTDIMLGIAASNDTATSSADGTVKIYTLVPGVIYRAKATTPANLVAGIELDCVTFDLTGTTYTVDEDEGSDENVHGLRIIDFDATNGTVDFMIKVEATLLGSAVA